MTRSGVTAITALLAVLAFGTIVLAAQSAVDLFQKALATERADGNLREAIQLYARVVDEAGRDRTLAARALLRMAECYERLGDPAARTIYERLVRDHGDRQEAAAARVQLARSVPRTSPSAPTMSNRLLWNLPADADLRGSAMSPDGRYFAYTDWAAAGDLVVRDLATGRNRTVSVRTHPSDYIDTAAIARDGTTIAYMWFNGALNRNELRLAALEPAASAQPRLLFTDPEVRWLQPLDWSPDGRSIAVQLTRPDRSAQLGLISVPDGVLRVLKSSEWFGASQLFFSPDGRYLAFDVPAGQTATAPRDVVVLAVDGSRETPAVAGAGDDTPLGWSPDGASLLFASDRGGGVGLWAQSMSDGRPTGMPRLLKSDIPRRSLGVGRTGSLYLGVFLGDRDIHVGRVNWTSRTLEGALARPIHAFAGFNVWPAWSPDGRTLAYLSRRDLAGGSRTLAVASLESGVTRDLAPQLNYVQQPRFAPDGRSLIVNGRDTRERPGVFRIDLATSETIRLADGASQDAHLSPDGTKLYFRARSADAGWSLVERDTGTGTERILVTRRTLFTPTLSPDGGQIAAVARTDAGATSLVVVPVAGGESREVFRARPGHVLGGGLAWTADGRSVIVTHAAEGATDEGELLQIRVDTSDVMAIKSPRPVVADRGLAVNASGQVAFIAGENRSELWVLENFLQTR